MRCFIFAYSSSEMAPVSCAFWRSINSCPLVGAWEGVDVLLPLLPPTDHEQPEENERRTAAKTVAERSDRIRVFIARSVLDQPEHGHQSEKWGRCEWPTPPLHLENRMPNEDADSRTHDVVPGQTGM